VTLLGTLLNAAILAALGVDLAAMLASADELSVALADPENLPAEWAAMVA
jgi:hypothetical protein